MKEVSADEWNDAIAEPLDLSQMDSLVKQSVEAWEAADRAKKIYSQAYAAAEGIDARILSALKLAGKSKYFVDGMGTVSLTQKAVVRVPNTLESKQEFFKYLREQGEEFYFTMLTVNSNSLNSWYNDTMEHALERGDLGFSVPGIEQPTTRESLRFTKDKHGKGKSINQDQGSN